MKKRILMVICSLASVLAISSMAGACILWAYQPKVPQDLLEKRN